MNSELAGPFNPAASVAAVARETPTSAELHAWAERTFERAYEHQQRRGRCSRGDFYAGYRAALISLYAWSQFKEKPQDPGW